jgi:hypothetical protein
MSRFDFFYSFYFTQRAGSFQSGTPAQIEVRPMGRVVLPAYDASFSLLTREATRNDEKGPCSTVELLGWEVSVASQFSSPVCSVIYSFQTCWGLKLLVTDREFSNS